jgi:UDP-N-acetylmuramyl pentapeptide phosphotransferase/UDP-N-acetylglucosamine-1-phosphate transferase
VTAGTLIEWISIVASAAALSAVLIILLRPLLVRYALARPNARSSHKSPTPQGGGIAVVAATLLAAGTALLFDPTIEHSAMMMFALVAAVSVVLATLGALDDIHPLNALPRLTMQVIVVVIIVAALPVESRILPFLPWWLERTALVFAGVWFVNLVNFMDGIDWMTVAEVVPVASGLALLGFLGALSSLPTLIALALLGAMLGFAPFNRPVAKLFLGDVGSLPIGLLLFWLLMQLAVEGHLAAALLLPLYYIADTTIILIRRMASGERITQAHRSHFYQTANDRGFTVIKIVGHVFLANALLVALALVTIEQSSLVASSGALVLGSALVASLLMTFARDSKR